MDRRTLAAACLTTIFGLSFAIPSGAQEFPRDRLNLLSDSSLSSVRSISLAHPGDDHSSETPSLPGSNFASPSDEGGDHHNHHDAFEPFERDHETIDGFQRVHLLKTEHAWLDSHCQFRYIGSDGIQQKSANQNEFEFEFFYVLNDHFGIVFGVPYSFINPYDGDRVNGFGDLSVGVQFQAYRGDYSILAFALNVITPTGDANRDLGEGHASLEPAMLWFYDLGQGNALQTQCSIKSPVSVREPQNEFEFNVGYSHTIAATMDCRWFRNLSPLVEFNGSSLMNGPDYGETVVNVTPGVRWIVGEENQMGVGMSFPITGDREWTSQVIVSYIAHY